MFEVELEFLNQKHFEQRHHQDKNFHKYRKYSVTRSFIYKQLNLDETCSDYISNVRHKTIDEVLLIDKNIKEDPFGIIGHLNKYRLLNGSFRQISFPEYSLNKKKRWLIPKVLSENMETYQKPELNLTVSLVTITPHGTKKYIGYSSNEQKICTNRYPSPKIVYCEQRDGHKKLKKWEHDISILYVTEVEKYKRRFKCNDGRYCPYCYPPRPKPTFDKNDIYDYESWPMDDLLSFEENENTEPLIPTSTYSLKDFIVNKKKKEKRLNKKKLSPKILDCGVFPKNEYQDFIFPEKLVPQETQKTPKNEAMPSYYLSKIDYENYALEKWSSKMEICDQIYPTVASISINNFEATNSNLNRITNEGIFKEFESLRNFSLIARNIHDKERRSYYFQQYSPKDSKQNSIKNTKTKIKTKSIFPSILPASSFLKTECHSIEEAKKKAIFLAFNLANPNKTIPPKPGFICRVCYIDDSDEQSGFALAKCMHYFCLECWHNHVESAISIGNVPIGCMEQECTNIVMPEIFKFFFKQDLVDKYANMISERRMMRKDFIGCHRCDQILFLDNLNYDLLENKLSICECGQIYCVNCSQKVHIPLTCEERRLFGGTEQSLSLHLSEAALCPGCGGLVDKTDGCNHMTCRCGFNFCYVCGGSWGHKCGTWEKKITRSPILMIDKNIETLFNLHPTANEVAIWRFNQIAIWRQKREYKNLWYLRKVYRQKTDDWLAMKVVLQYAQICQLIEYVHIKQCLYLSQKHKRKNSKHKQIFDLVNRLDYILEKLLDPSNDPEEILQRVFNLSTNLISLWTIC